MRVLILGATGLIGSHALRALRADGHTVIGASRHRPADERPEDWIEMDFGSVTNEVYRYLILPDPESCPS